MTDTTHRARQPKGNPTGGEFAAQAGSESAATLASVDPRESARATLANVLAFTTHVDAADLEHTTSAGHVCGGPPGAAYECTTARLGDELESAFDLSYVTTPDGHVSESHMTLSYNTTKEIAEATGCDRASVGFDVRNMLVSEAVVQAHKLASIQRGLDRDINDPQQLKKHREIAEGQYHGTTYDVVLVSAELGPNLQPMVRVQDFRGSGSGAGLMLSISRKAPSEYAVDSIVVDTPYGQVEATDAGSRTRVLTSLERDLMVSLGESFDGGTGSFEARLSRALGDAK